MRKLINGILSVLTAVSMYSCELWEKYPQDYFTFVFKNEKNNFSIIPQDNETVRVRDKFCVNEIGFDIIRKRLHILVSGIPPVGDTLAWSDTANSAGLVSFYGEKIEEYTIRIAGIPFNAQERPAVPYESKELVDSMAYFIDCRWGDNQYSGEVHARKYTVYVVD